MQAGLDLGVAGIGVQAPGLDGWPEARAVLSGAAPYRQQAAAAVRSALLAAGERRRATALITRALAAAEEATAGTDRTRLRSVFASASGDLAVIDGLCRALCAADRAVSPTQFHNSVHNAPAGYWAIACASRRASTSVSTFDGTFAAGLLEAASVVASEGAAIVLVAYEAPPPPPLAGARPVAAPFAVALLLGPAGDGTTATLRLTPIAAACEQAMADRGLEALRAGNPAARCLPLLAALARGRPGPVVLPYLADLALSVELKP